MAAGLMLGALPQIAYAVDRGAQPSRPLILADTNQDGVVDPADAAGKTEWHPKRTAIVLPNIGDKAKRCPRSEDTRFTDDQLEACHDAQDNLAHAPEYFAPVSILPIEGLSKRAAGKLVATGAEADKIRIFVKRGDSWKYLSSGDMLTNDELTKGATLGVDSRDVVRDAGLWDGKVTIQLTVQDGAAVLEDRVAMRVAPVVTHHHLQPATEIFAPESGEDKEHKQFVKDLSDALAKSGFDTSIERLATTDNWAQDFVEFGYVAMPGPNGTIKSLRIAIRSPQPTRAGGRALFNLRGPGVGVIQTGGDGYHQGDSFGNLETVPPYEFNGKSYPVGRIIYGDNGDGYAPHKNMTTFFKAQEVQAPIVLDTSWLIIGHVDEFVQFLPANNVRGWTIAVKDVPSALEVLRKAQREGHGASKAFSHPDGPQMTIDELLADKEFLEVNELARRKVELNLQILLAETGLSMEDVVRIPGLFQQAEFSAFVRRAKKSPEGTAAMEPPPGMPSPPEVITYGAGSIIAAYPAAVNGLLVDAVNYIPPQQWGPVVGGEDIMERAVQQAYSRAGIKAWAIDDWLSHHALGGEVHCGTNAMRQITDRWWK